MIYEHFALFINMLLTAQYLKYATQTEYLSHRIQLTLLRCVIIIMICASIQMRHNRWLCVSVETEHVESLSYIEINETNIERVIQAKVLGVIISSD